MKFAWFSLTPCPYPRRASIALNSSRARVTVEHPALMATAIATTS